MTKGEMSRRKKLRNVLELFQRKENLLCLSIYIKSTDSLLNYEIPVNVDYRNQRACRKTRQYLYPTDGKLKRKYI